MIHYGFTESADLALMRGFAQALAAGGITGSPVRADGGVVMSIT